MCFYSKSCGEVVLLQKLIQIQSVSVERVKYYVLKYANISSLVRLDSVLEVRVGQRTNGFERFPYEEVDAQSFSLIYEDVKG